MKKVLLLAAATMLFAVPAMAAISNTAHDLSSGSTGTNNGASDEVCVYCHTPHGAAAAVNAPLWNRTTVSSSNVYENATLDATVTAALVDGSDAALCLSCHDGSSMTVALNNPPNAGAAVTGLANIAVGSPALIGTDLSNDHPVGFSFATASVDTGIDTKTNIESVVGMTGALSFGGGDEMWCSSCHDVHGVTGVGQFLRIANTGSALCLTCHLK